MEKLTMTDTDVNISLPFLYIFDSMNIATIPVIKLMNMNLKGSVTMNPESIIVIRRINNASRAS
jgi:hypothetical protein